MNSGDFASRFDASMILPQREAATRPLRRSSPLIDACDAMKRCASSDSDISSENSATAFSPVSAAFSAKFAISALLWTMRSSATKLWSPGTVRSYVSSSPIGSIDTISSHQTSDVPRTSSRSSPKAFARCWSRGRESPRAPTCQLWLRGCPAASLTSAQLRAPLASSDALPHVGRRRVDARLEGVCRRRSIEDLRESRLLARYRDLRRERMEVGLPRDEHLARDRLGAVVDRPLQRADLRDACRASAAGAGRRARAAR